jgi:hypothetical protein
VKGHLQKRGERSWRICVYIGLDDSGKKRYTYQTVNGTKREAQKIMTDILHRMDQGTFVEPTSLTVGQSEATATRRASMSFSIRLGEPNDRQEREIRGR